MAEGRMLKRRITLSKKMAALKSDKSRLLWFYMLPFTDVMGRINADPEDIRDEILRKQRKGYTAEKIQSSLEELNRVGLIILYRDDEGQYLQFTRFAEEQNLNPKREAKTQIPAPLIECSGVIQSNHVKLSKDKLKKEKYIKEKSVFDISRRKYPGTKRELDTEFDYFRKTHSDWKEALPLLEPAVVNQAKKWKAEGTAKRYIPHFKTWLYNRFWERTEGLVLTEQEREELKEKNRRALEAKRAEIRKENGSYFENKTTEELQEMLKNKKFIMQWWLIKEILAERR